MNLTIESLLPNVTSNGTTIIKAIYFAAQKHSTQRRKNASQTPYINHPIEVMRILDMVGVRDPVVLAAAVLHDTVEDTETTIDEIESVFNEDIAVMVSEVTDDRSLSKLDRKLAQIEKMRTASRGARMIKIADKISNILDTIREVPKGWTVERVCGYACWSREVVLATSNGVGDVNENLVKMFFKLIYNNSFIDPKTGLKIFLIPATKEAHEKCLADFYESMKETTD